MKGLKLTIGGKIMSYRLYPVKKSPKKKSSKKGTDSVIQNKEILKKLKEGQRILTETLTDIKSTLLQTCAQPVVLCFGNSVNELMRSEKREFFDEFCSDLNKSVGISKEKEKEATDTILEPIDDHPRFRPPVSEERVKRHHSCTSTSSTQSNKLSLKIINSESIASKIKRSDSMASESSTYTTNGEIFFSKNNDNIPGLDLISKDVIKKEEDSNYVNMTQMNPFMGKRFVNYCKKSSKCYAKMTNSKTNAINAKYKCMGKRCAFYTSSTELFREHLIEHDQESSPSKDYYLYCSYCFYYSKEGPSGLINHHEIFHKYCRFQCQRCFYRSSVQSSVMEHKRQYHNENSFILECLDVPLLEEKEIDKIKLKNTCEKIAEYLYCCSKFKNYLNI